MTEFQRNIFDLWTYTQLICTYIEQRKVTASWYRAERCFLFCHFDDANLWRGNNSKRWKSSRKFDRGWCALNVYGSALNNTYMYHVWKTYLSKRRVVEIWTNLLRGPIKQTGLTLNQIIDLHRWPRSCGSKSVTAASKYIIPNSYIQAKCFVSPGARGQFRV